MKSVSQVAQAIQSIFSQADQIAQQSGFVQRNRKLTGKGFLQTLVLTWWNNPHASRETLSCMAASLGIAISAQGISDRLNEAAARFLNRMLSQSVTHLVAADPVGIELLQRFGAVIVLDSSTIQLPDALSCLWRGNGGRSCEGTQAAMKLHVGLELVQGSLHGPFLSDGRSHESASTLAEQRWPAGSLRITDLGYFKLDVFAQLAAAGSYFLSRLDPTCLLFDEAGQPLELLSWLQQGAACMDEPIHLGKQHRLPVRLIALRVPQEVAEARREKMQREARDRGQSISARRLALADWTLLITNVPSHLLNPTQALVLAKARWQIELLFKLWKQDGELDCWCGKKPWAILCELYAKLIALVFQHWLLLVGCWEAADRSLVKAAQVLRAWVPLLAAAWRGWISFPCVVQHLRCLLASGCRINPRKKRPNTYQFLLGHPLPYEGLT
jgi:DDE family transposase